ncbi:MAG: EamA family transporter RarD [Ahrensia sp.]|nr:EamA family transporter RarD [Ahrensia sp.]
MTQNQSTAGTTQSSEPLSGFVYALSAFLIWGFFPLYLKAVAHIPAVEVVAHRILWSIPVAGAILLWQGRTDDLKAAIKSPRVLVMAAVTATLISINWGIYVWAVAADRAMEGALGYYINPLVNVVLGVVLLGERFNTLQKIAVALAVIAVGILTFGAGGLPWVSLALAFSFGFYAYLRKTLPIGPTQGFLLEVLILAIPAMGYLLWLNMRGQGHFGPSNMQDMMLLMLSGVVTAVPLILYANGAKLLRFTTLGILQYISPTMIFLQAVFVFGEPFTLTRGIAFGFIWVGLALYTWSLFRKAG